MVTNTRRVGWRNPAGLERREDRVTPCFSPAAGSPVAVGTNPSSTAIADVNGDGKPDLVTANLNSDNVSVLLGGTAVGSLSTMLAAGSLTIADTTGVANNITAVVSGTNLVLTDATEPFASAPAGGTGGVRVNGGVTAARAASVGTADGSGAGAVPPCPTRAWRAPCPGRSAGPAAC